LGSVAVETHNGGHLKQYLGDPDITVVAGVDPSLEARNRALGRGLPAAYPSFDAAIENESFDYVSILTPTEMHLACCRLVAAAGKNILCEKPIAYSLKEALELEKLVKNSGISFSASMNLRFLPVAERIGKDIKEGRFGKLFFLEFDECTLFDWTTYGQRKPEVYRLASEPFWGNPEDFGLSRLIILDKAVHFIDLIDRWTGADVTSVYAQGGCQGAHLDAGENLASLNLGLSNGARCRLLHMWASHCIDRAGGELGTRIRINGDKAAGIYESSTKGATGRYSIYQDGREVFTQAFPPSERSDFADSLVALARTACTEQARDYSNLNSQIRVMRVIEACYESLTTNSSILM